MVNEKTPDRINITNDQYEITISTKKRKRYLDKILNKDTLSAAQSLFVILSLSAGAIIYLVKWEFAPNVETKVIIVDTSFGENDCLVRATFSFKNIGSRKISIVNAVGVIKLVNPVPLSLRQRYYAEHHRVSKSYHSKKRHIFSIVKKGESEASWQIFGRTESSKIRPIRPNETDHISFDFVVPKVVKTVIVAGSFIHDKDAGYAWSNQTLYKIRECTN